MCTWLQPSGRDGGSRGEKEEGRGKPHVAMGEWEGEFKRQMDPNKEEDRQTPGERGLAREDNGIRHYV